MRVHQVNLVMTIGGKEYILLKYVLLHIMSFNARPESSHCFTMCFALKSNCQYGIMGLD
jgi:hypothetical protein